jgi:hypothetical protein
LGSVTSRLQIPAESFNSVILQPRLFFARQHGRLDRNRLNNLEHLLADAVIHGNASERDATWFTMIQPAAMAGIPQDIMLAAGVPYRQLTTTATAPQQASQQTDTLFRSTGVPTADHVLVNYLLNALELFPIRRRDSCAP